MESPLLALGFIFTVFTFATIGALVANSKRRRPQEGLFLGLFLGPIGVAIEVFMPEWKRPMVDEGAWHSFRSVVTYQSSSSFPEASGPHLPGQSAEADDRQEAATAEWSV